MGAWPCAWPCCKRRNRKGRDENLDVDLIFRIAAIGIIVAVLNQLLVRSGREEQAMMTTLAGLIVVLMMIVNEIDALFQAIKSIFQLLRPGSFSDWRPAPCAPLPWGRWSSAAAGSTPCSWRR